MALRFLPGIAPMLLLLALGNSLVFAQKDYTLLSPDRKVLVQIETGKRLTYSLQYEETELISPSPMKVQLQNGKSFDGVTRGVKATGRTVRETLKPHYGQSATLPNHYNELVLEFREGYALVARAYNEGFAYRFVSRQPDATLKVADEEVSFHFKRDFTAFVSQTNTLDFQHSYEDFYRSQKISALPKDSLGVLPFVVKAPNGICVGIAEANVKDYPHMHVTFPGQGFVLKGALPKMPRSETPGGWRDLNLRVRDREDFLSEIPGRSELPWRVFVVAKEERYLLFNELVYKLADPAQGDFSWVKPGKVAWDWWSAMNLKGVPFKTGVNTDTYKYFIDFAATHGIEYVNIDEGWSELFDLTKLTPNIDMEEVFRYAKEKGVDLFVWCVARTLDSQMEVALDQFVKWGVKGLKVDFMDRDDRKMVDFYLRTAREAAKRQIHVNFHGAHKPTGLHRTYPNVLNYEAVRGLEYNKFSQPYGTTPGHAATIPFVRMLAGPMDYTPGAMVNANQQDFRVVDERPMSQGTRCQQLAMYVVYYAPLQMMADAPTAYLAEPDVLKFLAVVPTTWDETVPLDGEIGEYAVVARRKGDIWYVGGLTNWDARNLDVSLSFLGEGNYTLELYADGPNAHRLGEDYQLSSRTDVKFSNNLPVQLAPGGGFVAILKPAP